jgi:TonB family protein
MAVARGSADLEATRRREFRRMVVVSGVAHIGAVVLAMALPAPAAVRPAGVITVDLVAAPPSAGRRPAPAPAPAPEPPAVRPKPKPKQTVLPKKPTDRASKPKPKPKKPSPRREVFLEPEAKQEKSLEELMAEMRGESGEPTPEPVETAKTAAPSAAASSGPGQPVSPQMRDWIRRTKVHVQRSWVVAPGFRMQDLETHVIVDLDAAGNVRGTEIARRSGNPWYDESVVRGIQKASPLPPPPEAGDWPFVFAPEDAF